MELSCWQWVTNRPWKKESVSNLHWWKLSGAMKEWRKGRAEMHMQKTWGWGDWACLDGVHQLQPQPESFSWVQSEEQFSWSRSPQDSRCPRGGSWAWEFFLRTLSAFPLRPEEGFAVLMSFRHRCPCHGCAHVNNAHSRGTLSTPYAFTRSLLCSPFWSPAWVFQIKKQWLTCCEIGLPITQI